VNPPESVIIFGSKGFLGSYISDAYDLNTQAYNCFRDTTGNLIVVGKDYKAKTYPYGLGSIRDIILEFNPRIVFNTIAMIDFEFCEQNPKLAFHANADIPKTIAEATALAGSKMIQFSTDSVFEQTGKNFTEEDTPSPKSIYGISKLMGENNVRLHNLNSLIIRTNFVGFHKTKKTLFNYFYENFMSMNICKGYKNVKFNPLYIKDLVSGAKSMSELELRGIIHFCGTETISKYEYGIKILEQLNLPKSMILAGNIGTDKFERLKKRDLTLKSTFRENIYKSNYDIDLGIKDALTIAEEGNYGI